MTKYYPVCLDLNGKICLVFGGGEVAERKALGLIEAGASVTVVAPDLTATLRCNRDQLRLRHIGRGYKEGDLTGAYLAIAATDNGDANRAIAAEGRQAGVLVNAVDSANECDFVLPAVLRRGNLAISVSTDGRAPAIARWVKERLMETVTAEYGVLLDLAAEVRSMLRAEGRRVSAQRWQEALDDELLELIRDGDLQTARGRLAAALSAEVSSAHEEEVQSAD